MTTITKFERLQSEVFATRKLIESLPSSAIIERIGLQSRLESLEELLSETPVERSGHRLAITFRGQPVEGVRSIDATFASKALQAFVAATDTVTASLTRDDLKETGPLPTDRGRSLRIVDTAIGSFGFELELPPPASELSLPEFDDETSHNDPYIEAIDTTLKLLEMAGTEDDEGTAEVVAEIHPRAAAKIRAFAKVMTDNNATVALSFQRRKLRLHSAEQLTRIVDTLSETNVSDTTQKLSGRLRGGFLDSRRFEARVEDKVISGKFDRSIDNLGEYVKRWLDRDALLTLRVTSVGSRSNYILESISAPPTAEVN